MIYSPFNLNLTKLRLFALFVRGKSQNPLIFRIRKRCFSWKPLLSVTLLDALLSNGTFLIPDSNQPCILRVEINQGQKDLQMRSKLRKATSTDYFFVRPFVCPIWHLARWAPITPRTNSFGIVYVWNAYMLSLWYTPHGHLHALFTILPFTIVYFESFRAIISSVERVLSFLFEVKLSYDPFICSLVVGWS